MIGVIVGCVDSGKSQELARQGANFKGQVKVFKPKLKGEKDNGTLKIKDSKIQVMAESIVNPWSMMVHAQDMPKGSMVLIDDGHAFNYDLAHACLKISFDFDHCVMVAGRAQDWLGRPIEVMRDLLSLGDQIMKLYGECHFCKSKTASKTIELTDENDKTTEKPSCNACYKALMEQNGVPYVGNVTPAELAKMASSSKMAKSSGRSSKK